VKSWEHLIFFLLLTGVLGLTLAGLAVWWWWRRRRRQKPPAALLRYPLVLVHGILGFDTIGVGKVKQGYFRGIQRALEDMGVRVYVPRLPPLGSVPARAERLAAYIRALPEERVNIVAHSMGGLDARWAIARLDLGDKVASLVTIGTPHHGSPLADLAAEGPARWVREWFARIGTPSEAVEWLTTHSVTKFNVDAPDDPRVLYASVVCRAPAGLWRSNPLLVPTHLYLKKRSGHNDGVVPTESQRWGLTFVEHVADHWGQVGWSIALTGAGVYERIVRELSLRGF
jgi:triacylglycerol lipase